jgi:hypothetical protein
MEAFEAFWDFLSSLFGSVVQVPGLITGIVLIAIAAGLVRSVETRKGQKSTLLYRILASLAYVVGVPLILSAVGVGETDALIWGLVALAVSGGYIAAESGKFITVVGVFVIILAIGGILNVSETTPEGSVIANGVRIFIDQATQFRTVLFE